MLVLASTRSLTRRNSAYETSRSSSSRGSRALRSTSTAATNDRLVVTGKAPADDFVDHGTHGRTGRSERVLDPRRDLGKGLPLNEASRRQLLQFTTKDPRRDG